MASLKLLFAFNAISLSSAYTLQVLSKQDRPILSINNSIGTGYSPCLYNFNPAWVEPHPGSGLSSTIMIFRAALCPPDFGGTEDHLLYTTCRIDETSNLVSCDDVQPQPAFPFEPSAQDPRITYDSSDGYYYLGYYASGQGQNTTYLRRTQTPLDINSWELLTVQSWHRNICILYLENNQTKYVLFGETSAIPGIGIATTVDYKSFNVLNATFLEPRTDKDEVVLEASTSPIQLSDGNYLALIAAGTTGWVANGSYVSFPLYLDGTDPTHILQRDGEPWVLEATLDYELGNGTYVWNRKRTIFVTSLFPVQGEDDTFRIVYGAADAHCATGIIQILP
jgi:predicted GH43/DUF377 family glycosyl hydrolase